MTRIRERYEPLEVVGRGGQGFVVRAIDHQHGRVVAVKVREAPSPEARESLLAEARILLTVKPHPSLPLVREDFFEENRFSAKASCTRRSAQGPASSEATQLRSGMSSPGD